MDTMADPKIIDFLGHCTFCLKTVNDNPVQSSSKKLTSFSHMWQYLLPDLKHETNYKFQTFNLGNGTSSYSQVPPMCQSCSVCVFKVHGLHQYLEDIKWRLEEAQTQLKEIMFQSIEQIEEFEKLLCSESNRDRDWGPNTKEFIRFLRGREAPVEDLDVKSEDDDEDSEFDINSTDASIPSQNSKPSPVLLKTSQNLITSISPATPTPIPVTHNSYMNSIRVSPVNSTSAEEVVYHLVLDNKDEEPDLKIKSEDEEDEGRHGKLVNINEVLAKSVHKIADDIKGKPSSKKKKLPADPLGETAPPKKQCIQKKLEWFGKEKKKRGRKPNPPPESRRKYQCEVCGVRMHHSKLHSHYITHLPEEYINKCYNSKCKRLFISIKSLTIHLRDPKAPVACRAAREGLKTFPMRNCDTCDFKAESLLTLKPHLLLHETATKNYPCPFSSCSEKFSVRQSLILHLEEHLYRGPSDKQKCCVCRNMISYDEMETHLKEEHKVEPTFSCRHCPFIFPERSYLIDHLKVHVQEGISCDICCDNVKYSSLKLLRHHYFTEHQIGEKFVCEYCNAEMFTLFHLECHKRVRHLKSTNQEEVQILYKCELCTEQPPEFKYERSLVAHKISIHGAEPFSCKLCKETFNLQAKLRRHERSHLGITVQGCDYKCEICGKKFSRGKRALEHHKKIVHSTSPVEKEYCCDKCEKKYYSVYSLRSHKLNVHGKKEKDRVVCHTCGQSFTNEKSLQRHQLIHTGERPYSCQFCGQLFRQRETLNTHIKSHETLGDKFSPKGPMERGVRKRKTTEKQSSVVQKSKHK